MKIWFISDTHFGHNNVIKYCNRPFENTEEMDKALINNWNNLVSKDDIIYHLGDVAMTTNKERLRNYLSKLNGYKILVKGNHDSRKSKDYLELGFNLVYNKPVVVGPFICSHKPIINDIGIYKNVHGHTHDFVLKDDVHINVCVETRNYRPVLLTDLIKEAKIDESIFKEYGLYEANH